MLFLTYLELFYHNFGSWWQRQKKVPLRNEILIWINSDSKFKNRCCLMLLSFLKMSLFIYNCCHRGKSYSVSWWQQKKRYRFETKRNYNSFWFINTVIVIIVVRLCCFYFQNVISNLSRSLTYLELLSLSEIIISFLVTRKKGPRRIET